MKHKIVIFSLFTVIFILYLVFFCKNSIFFYLKLKGQETNLQEQIVELNKNNDNLNREIQKIKNDPFFIEKIARDELGLAKKDEIIILFQ